MKGRKMRTRCQCVDVSVVCFSWLYTTHIVVRHLYNSMSIKI